MIETELFLAAIALFSYIGVIMIRDFYWMVADEIKMRRDPNYKPWRNKLD